MIQMREPIAVVSKIAGHGNPATTLRYYAELFESDLLLTANNGDHAFDESQLRKFYGNVENNSLEISKSEADSQIPEDRLNQHKRNGFELLELRGPMDGHTAQELETGLLRYLKSQKADLSPDHVAGKFDGYSESWTMDSYKVGNLKELIDKASEAGF